MEPTSPAIGEMPGICLVMIVRNEEGVIRRCLESAKHLISYWCICDTGSTDQTEHAIRQTLSGIPGELHHDEWVNFGHNRSLSMERARGKASYHLLLDADMVLNHREELPELSADHYLIRFEGSCDYAVPRLVSDRHKWIYHGVTHEYIESSSARPGVRLDALTLTHLEDGGGRAQRYQRDTALLEAALKSDPGNSRYHYYLAQCYRDSGRYPEALEWYEKRVPMEGWNQEVWSALYQMGRMQEILNYDWRVILNTYLQAYNFRPTRLEPIHRMVRFYREHQQFPLGYAWSRLVTEVAYPDDILFVERDVYFFLLPLEHALCCFGTGRVEAGRSVCQQLLEGGRLTTSQVQEVRSLMEHQAGVEFQPACPPGRHRDPVTAPQTENPLSFVNPGWWERQ